METVTDFISLGSKITADGDCSHEIKRCLLLGRKVMTNLDSILKGRDITLLTKVCLLKAMVFPVVMYGCESWTNKKAECWRLDAFELWYWRRLLKVPWTARRSNHSFLKEISPEYSLEALMLKLKLQYFGHLMRITDSLEKTLLLGKLEGRRRRGDRGWDGWMTSPTWWTWVWGSFRSWWWTGKPGVLQSMGESDTTEWLKWTELIINVCYLKLEFWWFFSHVSRGFPGSFTSHDMDCIIELLTLYSETLDLTELCGKCSVFVIAGLDRLSPVF